MQNNGLWRSLAGGHIVLHGREQPRELNNGMWRSLVAHLTGGQGVAGSNPVIPTEKA